MTDVVNSVKSVGATFTSWDSCMSKTYCKWPVIAAIIIGSLIVLSILWCIFSCLCCGISLCTACTKCLTCGGCCGMCRGSRGRRKDAEYQAMPPTPTPYQGYQSQPHPMMYHSNGPQFATFDTGNKRSANVHEDSLPAMPSWDNATTRRVEDTSYTPPQPQHQQQAQPRRDDMEMESMLPYNQSQRSPMHSPIRESPYTSDLGAQNQNARGGYSNDYYDTPMSPAPTYYSTAPVNAPVAAGARAMSPQHTHDTGYNGVGGPAPYPSSRESTQFGAGYTNSPYHQSYHAPQQSPQETGVRPPSLLQVGRKPVPGTYREV